MTGTLYTVSKKPNSTARPGGTGTPVSFVLKGACSVQAPVFTMKERPAGNYLYVPSFSRYYWITDITYELGEWEVSCVCDVLATYKTEIGASSQYVTRAAAEQDPYLIDNLYPTRALPEVTQKSQSTIFTGIGTYILGVVGQNSTSAGKAKGLTYYALTSAQMEDFARWASSWSTADSFGQAFASAINQTVDTFAGQLLHIFDYIKTAFWIPIPIDNIAGDVNHRTDGTIMLGGYSTPSTVKASQIINFNVILDATPLVGLYIPAHPQESDPGVGPWINSAPYTSHYLDVPFVGEIPLDANVFKPGDAVVLTADISIIDGSAEMCLHRERDGSRIIINRIQTQLGVPIPIAVVRGDVAGAAGSIIGGVASALTGNFLGAAASVGNALSQAIPQPKTMGGLSGYHWGNLLAHLVSTHWIIVDPDVAQHGTPLCAVRQLSTLSGYILCENAEISTSGTRAENEEIMNYLNGGFYYE